MTVYTRDGQVFTGRVDEPKGDPGNTLSRKEIEAKALQLGVYAKAATQAEVQTLIASIWGLADIEKVGPLLP